MCVWPEPSAGSDSMAAIDLQELGVGKRDFIPAPIVDAGRQPKGKAGINPSSQPVISLKAVDSTNLSDPQRVAGYCYYLSRIEGSPNRIQVRRMSRSPTDAF